MKDQRITQYALGELAGSAREEFEQELAASEDLQRELNETIRIAEMLGDLPMPTDTFTEEKRSALRDECFANLKICRQRIIRRRVIVAVGLGAIAACLLIVPLSNWTVPVESHSENVKALAANTMGPEGKEQLPPVPAQAATPSPTDSTARLLSEAENYFHAGRFDLADKRYTEMTEADQSNVAARRGLERVELARQKYETETFNESRTRMSLQASLEGSAPVRRMETESPAASEIDALVVSGDTAVTAGALISSGNAIIADRELVVARQSENKKAVQFGGAKDDISRPSDGSLKSALVVNLTVSPAEPFQNANENLKRAQNFGAEVYNLERENVFQEAKAVPLSTFSIDVDTAGYSNVRRFLQQDQLPPTDAVRTEELINYFSYNYAQPEGRQPFSVNVEMARTPWDETRELVRIGLKGREMPAGERPTANLVFLIDVSGSMDEPNKLPLLQRSLQALVEKISPEDQIAIVTYAGSSGLVLPPTSGRDKSRILNAIERLHAGGSTNGGAGITLAYQTARKHFLKEGANRVILCTDGDFNVGTTSQDDLVKLIEKERASGVFLSVLGFGTGNLKDSTMEKLADKGNGNYAYIDSFSEGRKVLVEQMNSTLFAIAKDVKIQIEFNPARIAGYRLIGYENRLLAKEDFNDDKKDAGEIGAGHTVTALYEIIRVGQIVPGSPSVDPLKYQVPQPEAGAVAPVSDELFTVKLRYKAPDGDKSELLAVPVKDAKPVVFEEATPDFQFAAAVAAFGMKLRGSPEAGKMDWKNILKIARRNLGEDPGSYRAEFLTLIEKATRLDETKD